MTKPAIQKFNFTDLRYRSDPVSAFAELRQRGAVQRARIPLMGKMWLATTYASASEVLKNPQQFARDPSSAGRRYQFNLQWMLPRVIKRMTQNMMSADGEKHRRLRMLADQAFYRSNIQKMQPRIETLAHDQLQSAVQVARAGDGTVDLIEHFARPFPLTVICELLGLPEEDRPKFSRWFASLSKVKNLWGIFSVIPGIQKGYRYMQQRIGTARKDLRSNPGGNNAHGLISALIQAQEDGQQLSQEELESTLMLLLLAGHETTVHLISTGILTLLQYPDARQRFLGDDAIAQPLVNELLRFNSPVQFAKPRFVTADMDFYGQPIKRGESILPVIAAANYDPAVFEHPEQFNIDRHPNRHLSFGTGPHVCLGFKLAMAETIAALGTLFGEYPDLQPAFDLATPDWGRRMGMRLLDSLVVRL